MYSVLYNKQEFELIQQEPSSKFYNKTCNYIKQSDK